MIYAISGLKRTGKDTVAKFIQSMTGAKQYALAKPIKESLYVSLRNMINISWEDINGETQFDREKDLHLTTYELHSILDLAIMENHKKVKFEQWELTQMHKAIANLRSHDRMSFKDCFKYGFLKLIGNKDGMDEIDNKYKWSVRRLMQCLGTDIVVSVRRDYWLEMMEVEVPDNEDIILSDIRQIHEMDYCRNNGAKVIFVIKDGVTSSDSHITERGLEPKLGDTIINNDGTLEQLKNKVKLIVKEK